MSGCRARRSGAPPSASAGRRGRSGAARRAGGLNDSPVLRVFAGLRHPERPPMRNTTLVTAAAALVLASVGSASAAPPFSEIKKDDAIMNPRAAEAALAKSEAKDAKKNA